MPAFNPATLLLFPGLGLAALAIGLLVRRYSASALVIGLTGLLALASASTWIAAAGPMADVTQLDKIVTDNAELKKTIARQQAELEDARRRAKAEPDERQPPNAEVERLVGELRAEQSKRTEAERDAADADRKAAVSTAKVAELDEDLRKAQIDKVDAERNAALLEEKLQGAQPAPTPPTPPDLASIRRRLTDGEPPYYATREERELIPGWRGTWYVVRLLQSGKDWSFADREFVMADAMEIKASAVRLRDDVLLPLSQAGLHWRLFVRGAADARRVAGPVGRELFYLPLLPDGTHASEPRGKRVTVSVQNEDLPTLRADWLREIVGPALGAVLSGDIDILENPPQQEHGRTAELVLFVEW